MIGLVLVGGYCFIPLFLSHILKSYLMRFFSLLFSPFVPQSYFDIFSFDILLTYPFVSQSYFDDISLDILFSSTFVLQVITSFGSFWWFRRTQYIPSISLFYKNVGILLVVNYRKE